MEYGLIGEHLGHSFSKVIHEKACDREYMIQEIAPDKLDSFMRKADFKGINVTIPYKQAVIPYLDEISEQAAGIGAVNTIVNHNGRLTGHNTDYAGMRDLIAMAGIDPAGKKVLILGTGGTSKTAFAVIKDLGARVIYKVSRKKQTGPGPQAVVQAGPGSGSQAVVQAGPESEVRAKAQSGQGSGPQGGLQGIISYEEAVSEHGDADIIINTTPCGMFPNVEANPIDLDSFSNLTGLIDVIYNPLRTNLVIEAQKRGIPALGGLYMLVAQAVYAEELFGGIDQEKAIADIDSILTGKAQDRPECQKDKAQSDHHKALIDAIYHDLLLSRRNIVLSGMSLAGKTTVGRLLAEKLGKPLVDTDEEIIAREQRTITDIFDKDGEIYFRDLETEVCRELGGKNGTIISTGGGAILRDDNVTALKRNGVIFFLDRPLEQIMPTDDRPLADTADKVRELYTKRYPIYQSVCDVRVQNTISAEDVTDRIIDMLAH